ncbi:phycobilisome protein [Aphanothece hegewaldii CCALA 016]|uniref:Phycobilisome protein n=1 Tax=Aphanothece hegewaldii CCALA 016 TaxID=2107694 RepID=A0A2T1M2W0_9CHRO|nr:phycobilisome protein [Aphanothece hegewaldii]PSF39079.1 phycobilisome protein [Aphanothece hegewaldii CCALA 016]
MQLSERAKELIVKSRIVSFSHWKDSYSDEVISIFQKADDQGIYLSDSDSEHIKMLSPETATGLAKAQLLRDKAPEIIAKARQKVLETFPNITEPGGDLYPPARAEACWRDYWHFLRCITYGIAASKIEYTSQEGLNNMQLLYEELRVPLEAMVLGLSNLKVFGLQEFTEDEQVNLSPYFEHLISAMKQFTTV